MNRADPPRILLVEDDAVSQGFLRAALEAMPAQVDCAETAQQAQTLTAEAAYALWLIDAHLPDASGAALLAALRERGLRTPALAHTAEADPALHARLRAAGFATVLRKPIAVDALHAAVRGMLEGSDALDSRNTDGERMRGSDPPSRRSAASLQSSLHIAAQAEHDALAQTLADLATLPDWDDAAALRALNGNAAIIAGMRQLYRAELDTVRPQIAQAVLAADSDALHAHLHRLKASSGFVGAARVAAAAQALGRAPDDARAQDALALAMEAVLAAS